MRKQDVRTHFDQLATQRDMWRLRNRIYHASIEQLCAGIIPAGRRVLELGCATGDLLAAMHPSFGLGLDLSGEMVRLAHRKYPQIHFVQGDVESLPLLAAFDYILFSDVIGHLDDIWQALRALHRVADAHSRLVITYYNFVWEGLLRLAEKLGLKMPEHHHNWLGMQDIHSLLNLADWQIERSGMAVLLPVNVPGFTGWVNRVLASRGPFSWFSLVQYVVARPAPQPEQRSLSVSVIVPCRNEVDNVSGAVERTPDMGTHTEIIFVDGASTDGTVQRIEQLVARHSQRDIKLIHQVPREEMRTPPVPNSGSKAKMLKLGKGDAVRKGFAAAKGDVLMILDADLTVQPEELPKFYWPLAEGKAQFINGTRLVYPMENEAMPFVNYWGNKCFSLLFTWLLGQPIKDTLCGTKALHRRDYEQIVANRAYFGNFDPFGDFDLLFGAARLQLKIAEMPVRYRRRVAGYSKVQVYKHGLLLIRMSWIAFLKFKWARWWKRG